MSADELAMQFIVREYGFKPEQWSEDSLGNDPETIAAYYAFIAGYEAAANQPRVITRVMDDGIKTKDGCA